MKKFNFLIGALGGALGGFVLSNKKLRNQLGEAKTKKEAAKILGEAIQKSGSELANDTKKLLESEEVQSKLKNFKEFANEKWADLQTEVSGIAKRAVKTAKKETTKKLKAVKKAVRSKAS